MAAPFLSLSFENEYSSLAYDKSMSSFFSIATLQAPTYEADEMRNRAGMDLVAVLDRSGSMKGKKMNMLHQTVQLMVENLKPCDRLCLVSYDAEVETVLPLTQMDPKGKETALQSLTKIKPRGSTDLNAGLQVGLQHLTSRMDISNEVASVLLMTDGLANAGVRAPQEILGLAKAQLATVTTPISVFTFGYGSDHDATLLSTLATECGGSYYFMRTTDSIPEAFGDCLGGLMSVTAQNITVNITAATDISINAISTRFPVTEVVANKEFRIALGDIYSEEQRDLVFDLSIPAVAEPMEQPTLSVQVEYLNALTGDSDRHEMVCTLTRTGDGAPEPECSVRVDQQRNRIKAATTFEQAEKLCDSGNLGGARALLETTMTDVSRSRSATTTHSAMLLGEMRRSMEHVQTPDQYREVGKKKMQMKSHKHWGQREVEVDSDEELQYANRAKLGMRANFKK